jgi:hypothetical protein
MMPRAWRLRHSPYPSKQAGPRVILEQFGIANVTHLKEASLVKLQQTEKIPSFSPIKRHGVRV